MQLPEERVGSYLRALRAGLEALAPHGDYVPLEEQLTLLEALDPACSGSLLSPAEIDPGSGLPALTWLERARAEQVQATRRGTIGDRDDEEIERAYALDPSLGARLKARRRLHRLLRERPLLPSSRLAAVLKRVQLPASSSRVADREPVVEISYDHLAHGRAWERVKLEVAAPQPLDAGGAVRVRGRREGVELHQGLRHLLARHALTPLVALHAQVQEVLGGSVLRLVRSRIGPFWFPGISLPEGVPPDLSKGLVVQISSEVVGRDVRQSRHLDPWLQPPPGELVPRGCRIFRERRFCASPALLEPIEDWGQARGVPVQAVPLNPRPRVRRRSL
jgi:hypothetical protein